MFDFACSHFVNNFWFWKKSYDQKKNLKITRSSILKQHICKYFFLFTNFLSLIFIVLECQTLKPITMKMEGMKNLGILNTFMSSAKAKF